MEFCGYAWVEHWRRDRMIDKFFVPNGICNGGIDDILGVYFDADSQSANWYLGLINNSPTPTLAATDTLASHSGWSEFTNYTGSRQEWAPDTPSSQSITNSVLVVFPITASATIHGFFCCSVATGTSGILWATAAFATAQAVLNGDNLKITYTVNGAEGS